MHDHVIVFPGWRKAGLFRRGRQQHFRSGHGPTVSVDEGRERTVAWYREHRDDKPANDLM
jgi:hypothetical protein